MEDVIIIGLFIITNRYTNKINIFIKYLVESLIEMFKPISNLNQHQNIINNIYFLLKNN